MKRKYLLTIRVFLDERREPGMEATRHALDPVELYAAAALLQQGAFETVVRLSHQRVVAPPEDRT